MPMQMSQIIREEEPLMRFAREDTGVKEELKTDPSVQPGKEIKNPVCTSSSEEIFLQYVPPTEDC